MARGVAINVGANTNVPGFRGPIYPDGSFEFVPIPESEPTDEPVPTYADLPISFALPTEVRTTPVHLDPSFVGYGPCERYTYGDPHGVKARPLLDLEKGDHVFFYATLDRRGDDPARRWILPEWGAYIIARFRLACDPVAGYRFDALDPRERSAFAGNAHLKRSTFDAAVLLLGDRTGPGLYDRAIPLSRQAGVDPNRIVTDWSTDSGAGPWWRRPLRFDADGTRRLLALEGADDNRLAAVADRT